MTNEDFEIKRGNKRVEPQQRVVEGVRKISADALKQGGFEFDLGEDATDDDVQAFQDMLNTAKENNQDLYLEPGVTVADKKYPSQPKTTEPDVSTEEEDIEDEDDTEDVEDESEESEEDKQPAQPQAQPQQPQQNQRMNQHPNNMPNAGFQYGNNQWQYDPFTGQPIKQAQQQQNQGQGQQYNPQQIQPSQGQGRQYNPQQANMPQGMNYPQGQQPQNNDQQKEE